MSVPASARADRLARLRGGSFVGDRAPSRRPFARVIRPVGRPAQLESRPAPVPGGRVRQRLARAQTVTLAPARARRPVAGAPKIDQAMVGSPLGQTSVAPPPSCCGGSRCGWRGAQVEIHRRSQAGGPGAARDPGLASLRAPVPPAIIPDAPNRFTAGGPVGATEAELADELVPADGNGDGLSHTERGFRSLDLRQPYNADLGDQRAVDIDAADVTSIGPAPARSVFAVSLRERRITAGQVPLLRRDGHGLGLGAGAWQQFIFRPTLLSFPDGGSGAARGPSPQHLLARLQPVTVFSFDRDNLWMEQFDVPR